MERFPWHPRFRQAASARRLVIAAVAALTLAVVAAVGMAATSAPGPNGCPTNKSLKTAPIADLAPPARTQIEAFDVLSGPINERDADVHAEGARREHLQRHRHQRRERLRDRSAV